jgi:V8-like Glu-specific endopeptidase
MRRITMKVSKLVFVVMALMLMAMTLAPAGTANAAIQPQTDQQAVTTMKVSAAQQTAALAFWNRDTISQARPMEMPIDTSADIAPVTTGAPEILGAPEFTLGGPAAPDADRIAQKAFAADWKTNQASGPDMNSPAPADDTAGSSQVYTSYMLNWAPAQTIYPHKWVGRLSFSTIGGTSYCSATAISGNNFVTAAHCVYDTSANRWYSNWVFTPAYRAGSAPYGSFAATTCTILTAWINLSGGFSINGWSKYDMAVCTVGTNSIGQTLNGAVGWAGRSWNAGYVRHFHDLGYPFNSTNNTPLPFAGMYLRTCAAESFQQTTDTRGMGCNLGPGISGGPWLIGYSLGVVNGYVDGVNSGFYVGTANMYGPRFTSSNIVPICNARGC